MRKCAKWNRLDSTIQLISVSIWHKLIKTIGKQAKLIQVFINHAHVSLPVELPAEKRPLKSFKILLLLLLLLLFYFNSYFTLKSLINWFYT